MIRWPFLAFLPCFFSSVALAGERVPSQNYQLVSGNCNLVVNASQGEAVKIPASRMCSDLSSTASVADSLRKIERFIEASNPTEVKLSSVSLIHWAGDAEKYLTLSLVNISGLPAEKVKVKMLDVVRTYEQKSKSLSFSPSQAFPKAILDNLGIPKSGSVQIPVAPASEIVNISRSRVSPGYDLIGVGLSPAMPDEMTEEYARSKGFSRDYHFKGQVVSLGVELKYKNIFGGSSTVLTGVYLYYGNLSGS